MRHCGSRLGWSQTRSRFVTKCLSTPLRTEDKQLHARADTTTKCELGCNPKQRVASRHNRKNSLTLLIRTLEGHKNCIGMRKTISHLPSSNSREHDLAPHVQQHIVVRVGNRMCSLAGLVWCWSLSCVYPFFKNGLQFTSGQVVRYSTRLQRRLVALRPPSKACSNKRSRSVGPQFTTG